MDVRLLGIPAPVWAGTCLLLAALWTRVWPRSRAAGAGPARRFLLRWAHALVWLLLAAAAGALALGLAGAARPLALLAAAMYAAFMGALVTGDG